MKKIVSGMIRKSGLLPLAKKLFRSFNFNMTANLQGSQIIVPQVYGTKCNVDEKWMMDVLKPLLNIKSGAFIDVGVNIGQTLVQVKAIDRTRNYIGFEPNPSCNFYLELLKDANRFENCLIIPAGLYTENSVKILDIYGDNLTNSGGSLVKDFRAFRKNHKVFRKLVVPVYSFETVERHVDIGTIGIVKIDVEGGELEVIESLRSSIVRYKPVIILEVLPVYSAENSDRLGRQKELEQLIRGVNYRMFRILKGESDRLAGLYEIQEFGIHSNLEHCDYLLIASDEFDVVKEQFKVLDHD